MKKLSILELPSERRESCFLIINMSIITSNRQMKVIHIRLIENTVCLINKRQQLSIYGWFISPPNDQIRMPLMGQ